MAEVQTSQTSGEMTQRFIAFVMMQAQQAALFMGQIPHPNTGATEVNLEAAKLFIDQLEMVREKTRGNLSSEESQILTGVLADLQMAFVKASSAPRPPAPESPAPDAAAETPKADAAPETDEDGPRKRFSKSYAN